MRKALYVNVNPGEVLARRARLGGLARIAMDKAVKSTIPEARQDSEPPFRGIAEVAQALGVTPRTLRFYEDRGLIQPRRVGQTRLYARRDIARMQVILRGKRLGFSLAEIEEFLNLYDADPQHLEQMRALAARCRERIGELQVKRAALEETIAEIETLEREALQRIAERTRAPRARCDQAKSPDR
jgi:DNA-binding transcriptional MerR regulator